jgi:hypothetical protein
MSVLDVLRLVVATFGALMLATGLLVLAGGGQASWSGAYPAILGVVAILVALFERARYGPGSDRDATADRRLRPTQERFVDPTTGQHVQVWIDPASGERSYLPDGESRQK